MRLCSNQRHRAFVASVCLSLCLLTGAGAAAVQDKEQKGELAQPARKVYVIPEGPWPKVLEWLTDETELPFIGTVKPIGDFRWPTVYEPLDQSSLGEVIDFLNETLLDQKLLLIKRQASFTVWPADEPMPDSVRYLPLEDLPKRPRTEYDRINLELKHLNAEKAAPWAKSLLGPFGQVIPLEEANQLILIDSVENLRRAASRILDADTGTFPDGGQIASWKAALDWLSNRTKLPFAGKIIPTSSFRRPIPAGDGIESLADIIDNFNDQLRGQKMLLVRGERALYVVWTDEAIEPAIVPNVRWGDLAERGRTELVSIRLALKRLNAGVAMGQIKPMLSLLGSVRKVNDDELVVLDTAGNLQVILSKMRSLGNRE